MITPTFLDIKTNKWHFWGVDGTLSPGYSSREVAERKYEEYGDYTINAPACHHPATMVDAFDIWMGRTA